MIVAPCSINTMSAIAAGISSNLMIRAAGCDAERAPETDPHGSREPAAHRSLENDGRFGRDGRDHRASSAPGFYNHPASVLDLVDHSVDRVLDLIGTPDQSARRWQGPESQTDEAR